MSHAIRTLDPELTTPALIPDLTEFIQSRPATLRTLTLTHEDENAYDARVQGLLDALIAMSPDGLYGLAPDEMGNLETMFALSNTEKS